MASSIVLVKSCRGLDGVVYDVVARRGTARLVSSEDARKLEKEADIVIDCSKEGLYLAPCFTNMLSYSSLALSGTTIDSWEDFIESALSCKPSNVKEVEEFYREGLCRGVCLFLDVAPKNHSVLVEAADRAGIGVVLGLGVENLAEFEDPNKLLDRVEEAVMLHEAVRGLAVVVHKPLEELSGERATEYIRLTGELFRRRVTSIAYLASVTRRDLHSSRTRYGVYPVELLYKIGLLGPRTMLACSGWIASWEIRLLAENKAGIVDCPSLAAETLTGGILPYEALRGEGVSIGIGTTSRPYPDVASEALLAYTMQRHYFWSKSLSYEAVVEAATSLPPGIKGPYGYMLVKPLSGGKLDYRRLLHGGYSVHVAVTGRSLVDCRRRELFRII